MTRYILLEQIGDGSSSVIHKVYDTLRDRIVAIKELDGKAGFPKREIDLALQITHLHVCRYFDCFETETGSTCIAMEFVDGGNLRSLMERSGPLPVEKTLSIARQILDGLDAIHTGDVVHRDLKPENTLLTSTGTVKVSDFGHARLMGTTPSLESAAALGTAVYMSPEQKEGRACDARSDIYSFGIILHEMLSGIRPPSPLPPSTPAYLEAVIQKCLELDPARRFASVSEVRSALSPFRAYQRAVSKTAIVVVSLAIFVSAVVLLSEHVPPDPSPVTASTPSSMRAPAAGPPAPNRAAAQKTIQRIAVLDFENVTGDKSLNPYTVGISETIGRELEYLPGLTVIERNRINEVVREIRSAGAGIASVPPAPEKGKLIGADALVAGRFQKTGDNLVLTADVIDVETGDLIRTRALAEGEFKDLYKLQADLAKQLAVAIHGTMTPADRKEFETAIADFETGRTAEAFQTISDGLYFLREDLPSDALSAFDLALTMDPGYADAHYYRGLALAKLNRLDEAINAFTRALPRSTHERLVLWGWDAPFASLSGRAGATVTEHGIVRGIDFIERHLQSDFRDGQRQLRVQKRIFYHERNGKRTVLHLLDLERDSVRRLEVPDEIPVDPAAYANDSFTVLSSLDANPRNSLSPRIVLYGFSAESNLLWHSALTQYGKDRPIFALAGDAFYIYLPGLRRLDLLDARTGTLLWRRESLTIDGFEAPLFRHTRAYGDLFIVKSQDVYRAVRRSDGTDAWTVPVRSLKASELANGRVLIVFEPERRVFTVDLETGRTVAEIKVDQYVDFWRDQVGSKWLVGAMLSGNTLYVMSTSLDLWAIDVAAAIAGRQPQQLRILWQRPIGKKIQSFQVHGNRIYLGSEDGKLFVLNPASGEITHRTELTNRSALIEDAGDDAVLVRSNNTLYGLSPIGEKIWEYAPVESDRETAYFNHVMTVYTSPLRMSALDAKSGELLWQYDEPNGSGRSPRAFAAAGRFFILGENGVKEYSTGKRAAAVTEKETRTQIALAYLAKGELEQARVSLKKASDIDPNYPSSMLATVRLLKTERREDAAGSELARYADLVGPDSKEGQRAVSEMKRDHGLLWETAIGPQIAGDPIVIENRLVNLGRGMGRDLPVAGLDIETGALIWRYNAERFAASVAVTQDRPLLWYVSGSVDDSTAATLHRIDIRSGEPRQMANWRRTGHISQGWIAYAAGRVFVATAAPDLSAGTLQIGLDCFDAASGARLWQKTYDSKASANDRASGLGEFIARDDSLTYAIGENRWTVRAADGSPLMPAPEPAPPAHLRELRDNNMAVESDTGTGKVVAQHRVLWLPSSFRIQGSRLYAFTRDGHAYAMK